MFTIEYDSVNVDFGALPAKSQVWLAREGFAHGYGNRVASKVIGKFRADARKTWQASNEDGAWAKLTAAEQSKIEKAGIPDSEGGEYREAIMAARADFMVELNAGTLSEGRVAGPKRTPLEVEMDAIARRETIEILLKNGLFVVSAKKRVPKSDDEFVIKGETVTFDDLCDRRQAREQTRIEKEARKVIAARDASAAKAAGESVDEAF